MLVRIIPSYANDFSAVSFDGSHAEVGNRADTL
jgi:hypothetical protein